MNDLKDVISVFNDYRDAPTTMNGHKLLQKIKSGELQQVLEKAQSVLDEVEYNKVFCNPDKRKDEIIDKYCQIIDIVMSDIMMSDCQPMA